MQHLTVAGVSVSAQPQLRHLHDVVPAEVEGGEGGGVAEGGGGQTPDVVVGQVQPLKLGQTLERVLLELESQGS